MHREGAGIGIEIGIEIGAVVGVQLRSGWDRGLKIEIEAVGAF